jgi:hypothetical protein
MLSYYASFRAEMSTNMVFPSLGVFGDFSGSLVKLNWANLLSLLAFLYKAKREQRTVKHEVFYNNEILIFTYIFSLQHRSI